MKLNVKTLCSLAVMSLFCGHANLYAQGQKSDFIEAVIKEIN
ncbi:MAG: hypothetical protein ACI837_003353 [Crocinitomicaceae bacterium]|jgi:hypothetical protein